MFYSQEMLAGKTPMAQLWKACYNIRMVNKRTIEDFDISGMCPSTTCWRAMAAQMSGAAVSMLDEC